MVIEANELRGGEVRVSRDTCPSRYLRPLLMSAPAARSDVIRLAGGGRGVCVLRGHDHHNMEQFGEVAEPTENVFVIRSRRLSRLPLPTSSRMRRRRATSSDWRR